MEHLYKVRMHREPLVFLLTTAMAFLGSLPSQHIGDELPIWLTIDVSRVRSDEDQVPQILNNTTPNTS